MKKLGLLIAFLNVLCMVVSAQNIQSIVGTYEVSEVCTLEEDTTYKEVADYTITLEAYEDTNHDIRFLIPAHGIPDFVLAASNNDGSFSFSQKFNLENSIDDEPCYLHIHGDGRVRKDLLTMEYVLNSTVAYGTLQCDVKSIRQTVGMKGDKAVQPVSIFPNPATETITLSAVGCELQKVEILDVNGRVLYAACNDTDSFRYNVSWMPSGLYFARVTTPCGVLTEKFSVR